MIGCMDESMNIFLYLDNSEILEIQNGLEGKLFKYSVRKVVSFQIKSDFGPRTSADWNYLEDDKIAISLGNYLYETLVETGKAYSRFYAGSGAELFIYDKANLGFSDEMNLEQIKFNIELAESP
jgi:hypothetical protein